MKYRPEIDGLRAVAVLSVLLFHLGFHVFSGGFIGVDVFFVISGYLITSIIQKDLETDSFSISKFYDRRFRRIIPALYFLLIFTVLFTWFFFTPNEMKAYCKSLISSLLFYSNFFFWSESGYFDLDSEMKPLLHTWSLSIEEQFYIFYPTILFFLHRYFKSKKTFLVLLFCLVSFLGNAWLVIAKPDAAFYFSPVRAWELLMGAALALKAFPILENRRINEGLSWIGLFMIAYSVFLFSSDTKFPGFSAAIPCLGTALLVYSTETPNPLWVRKILSNNLMTGIGKISYSLYLWHWPAIVFAKYYLMRELSYVDRTGLAAIVFFASFLSWKFVEQPFRTKKGIFKNNQRLLYAMGACTAVLLVFAYLGSSEDRTFRKMNPAILQYSKGAEDKNPDRKKCHSMPLRKVKNGEICDLGPKKSGPPQFAVWGDSFADAMLPAIKELADGYGVHGLFASTSSCGPLLGVSRPIIDLPCDEFNNAMIETVKRLEIKNVLFVSAWGMRGYSLLENSNNSDLTNRLNSVKYLNKNAQTFFVGFENMIQYLQKHHVNIWMVDKIPAPRFNVPSYLARYEMFHKDKGKLKISREKYLKSKSDFSQVIEILQKEYTFHMIDPSIVLCSDQCIVEYDGKPLYYDGSHLSAYGAKHVMEVFEPFFQSLRSPTN